jgi:hypothetical protein
MTIAYTPNAINYSINKSDDSQISAISPIQTLQFIKKHIAVLHL